MTFNCRLAAATSVAALATALLPATVTAQPVGAALSVDEVVVTARRRDEVLSRVPVSANVLPAATIKDAQITSELDLRSASVGLQVRATINSNQLNFAARGASQDGFSGTRPGVLPYINEVQISGGGGATAFYDLENIQVLMGPQGTLFGRSATGGAVLYQTARPTDELSGYVSALGGDLNAMKFEGAVSGPLAGDVLKGRLAGVYTKRNGFQKNYIYGGREGDYERYGARASLLFAPTDRLTNELVVDYFESDSESTVGVISGLLPLGAPGQPPFVPAQLIYGGVTDPVARATGIAVIQGALAAQGANLPTAVIAAAYDTYFADPRRPKGGLAQVLADQKARGPFSVGTESLGVFTAKNWVITNTTAYEIGDGLKLKNIFGYVNLKSLNANDTDGSPYVLGGQLSRTISPMRGANVIATEAFSDEIQLQGQSEGGLDYVVGVYLSDEKSVYHYDTDFFDLLPAALGLPAQRVFNFFTLTNRTLAPFAQATVPLNSNGLSATAGVRYTSEKVGKKRLVGDSGYGLGGDNDKSRTYNSLNWTLGVQWQLNPETLLYVASRRAYKSGGYNGSVAIDGSAANGGDEYTEESVTDVEAGAKYDGLIGGRRFRASAAAYHNWLKDSQRTAFTIVNGGPAAVTVNVPRGKIYGVEAQASYRATEAFTFGANVNLMHSKFTDGRVVVNAAQLIYDRLPDTPKYSFSAYGDYRTPVSGDVDLLLHADVYGQGASYTSPRSANNAGTKVSRYEVVNLRAGLQNSAANWTLMANVKNVFDKTYYVGGVAAGEIYQVNTLIPAEPRTFTIEARYSF